VPLPLSKLWPSLAATLALSLVGCAPEQEEVPANAIRVGAILPFTGKEAAIGRNLEQALLLAVRDVNEAGGIEGRPLTLVTRDSNSGSERGFDELLQLLYNDQVDYLIGPEETELANAIVPDVKGLDVLNILPGYAAPAIEQTSTKGSWVRLAPSTNALGCAMAKHVFTDGAASVNTLTTLDDYNTSLASDFISQFGALRGKSLPSVTASVGAASYLRQINQVLDYQADRTLLMAPPASAATIATEWTVADGRGAWYLSPLLRAEVFVQNIPFGSLNGTRGLSPSLSLKSECVEGEGGAMTCSHGNASAFSRHFAAHWRGDRPFPAAHFYYDAVVLLALALEQSMVKDGELPRARELRDQIRALGDKDAQPVRWGDLSGPMTEIRLGTAVRYVGAGAEYEFDVYGAARHVVFDTWMIADDSFIETGTLRAECISTF
jgi:neutral amino acid transport system substrate-binding protein